jgi:hypothetical protein
VPPVARMAMVGFAIKEEAPIRATIREVRSKFMRKLL